jgi:hypothetical protein
MRRRLAHALGAKDRAQAQQQWIRGYREQQRIKATYDAARTPDDLKNYWANVDGFDADSAHSKHVRDTLVRRSRYELANNGFSDGMTQTYATDLVGTGPKLRMTTGSTGYNQLVEFWWNEWCKAVQFRRKLWCMAHAKDGDGEAISVLRFNPGVNHPVKLDIVQYETEQCQTPMLSFGEPGRIDGIDFDEFGNPTFYNILRQHPGSSLNGTIPLTLVPESVPANYVLHWFKLRRPRQHRGVPERASTLNLGAVFRRGREATLSTWEKVASWTFFLKGMFEPLEDEKDPATAMSSFDIVHNMMTALPNTVEPWQPEVKHPGPNYEEFHKLTLNEQARPKSMPLNKAMCNSASYNYASGRLDHATYYGELDFERADCDELCLDKMFTIWYDLAVAVFGWLGGDPDVITAKGRAHTWDWPKHKVADVEAEANASAKRLQTGQVFITRLYSDNGYDFEDDCAEAAQALNITPEKLKERLLNVLFPEKPEPGVASLADRNQEAKDRAKQQAAAGGDDISSLAAQLAELHKKFEKLVAANDHNSRFEFSKANGNGALSHAN